MMSLRNLLYLGVAAANVAGANVLATQPLCSTVDAACKNQQGAVIGFCSSYIGIPAATSTATVTKTSTSTRSVKSAVTTTTGAGGTVTSTRTASATTTVTSTSTAVFTVRSTKTTTVAPSCGFPGGASKRKNKRGVPKEPKCLNKYPSGTSLSSACSCLSSGITTSTRTTTRTSVVTTTTTTTIPFTSTVSAGKTIIVTSTQISTSTATVYTTSGTTVTSTSTVTSGSLSTPSPFYISDGNKYAQVIPNGYYPYVQFQVADQAGASLFHISNGNLYIVGNSQEMVTNQKDFHDQPIQVVFGSSGPSSAEAIDVSLSFNTNDNTCLISTSLGGQGTVGYECNGNDPIVSSENVDAWYNGQTGHTNSICQYFSPYAVAPSTT